MARCIRAGWLEQMYTAHAGAICRFLGRFSRREEDVADMMQEVFLRVLRLAPQERIQNPRAYLFQA